MDGRLASLAARQHGVVARWQLPSVDVPPGVASGHVRRGALRRLAHGVYAVEGAPATPRREAMAAALRAGPGARVVGERMLAAVDVRGAAADGPFTVLLPPGRRLVRVRFPWRTDAWSDRTTGALIDGIPSVDVPRNLLEAVSDAAADDAVLRLADGVRWTGRHRMTAVARLASELVDHPGVRRLVLLGCLDPDAPESDPERILEVVLAPFAPERQVVVLPGVRVDFLLRAWRVAVEYDGPDHESGHARRRDAERDARVLAEAGIRTVRVTSVDLRDPAAVLRRILACATIAG